MKLAHAVPELVSRDTHGLTARYAARRWRHYCVTGARTLAGHETKKRGLIRARFGAGSGGGKRGQVCRASLRDTAISGKNYGPTGMLFDMQLQVCYRMLVRDEIGILYVQAVIFACSMAVECPSLVHKFEQDAMMSLCFSDAKPTAMQESLMRRATICICPKALLWAPAPHKLPSSVFELDQTAALVPHSSSAGDRMSE